MIKYKTSPPAPLLPKVLRGCVISILLLFLLNSPDIYGQHWLRQISPTTKWLNRCTFPDSVNGWVGGDSGIILHTSNAGQNWQVQPTGVIALIDDIYFLNKNYGWAIANGYLNVESIILKTTNGGVNWLYSFYPDSNAVLNAVYYFDSLKGIIGGYNGYLRITTNGGLNWIRITPDTGYYSNFHINKIRFLSGQVGFLCGGKMDVGGIIWRTTDGGFNWHGYDVAPEPIYDIFIKNQDTIFGCGGDFEFGVTYENSTDGGVLWEYRPLEIFGVGQSLGFRTQNELWIPLGFSQRWAYSTDRGQSFTEVMGNDSSAVYDVKFLDTVHGWAFGSYGSILKFNSAMIGIKPISASIPVMDKLLQNYPNPFNPSTKIDYTIIRTAHVKITLYDVTGREIMTLLDDIETPGNHTLNFYSNNLSSGVYFYKMTADDYTKAMKMVIIK